MKIPPAYFRKFFMLGVFLFSTQVVNAELAALIKKLKCELTTLRERNSTQDTDTQSIVIDQLVCTAGCLLSLSEQDRESKEERQSFGEQFEEKWKLLVDRLNKLLGINKNNQNIEEMDDYVEFLPDESSRWYNMPRTVNILLIEMKELISWLQIVLSREHTFIRQLISCMGNISKRISPDEILAFDDEDDD